MFEIMVVLTIVTVTLSIISLYADNLIHTEHLVFRISRGIKSRPLSLLLIGEINYLCVSILVYFFSVEILP